MLFCFISRQQQKRQQRQEAHSGEREWATGGGGNDGRRRCTIAKGEVASERRQRGGWEVAIRAGDSWKWYEVSAAGSGREQGELSQLHPF